MFATRKEAKVAGEKYYFTGRTCPHGHTCKRFTSNKQCFECNSERRRKPKKEPRFKTRQERRRVWRQNKFASDPVWAAAERAKKVARERRRLQTDDEYRKRKNAKASARLKHRYHSDPAYRLSRTVASCITQSLNANGISPRRRTWEDLVEFTLKELIDHITPQLKPGMTWDNYGPAWHIDHIKPRSKCESFEEAWKLSNLQPLFARENIIKSDKWEPLPTAKAA